MNEIGFTGTRRGLTDKQRKVLAVLLRDVRVFHHGDCVGADAEAHQIAREAGAWIVGHPPEDPRHRAFCRCDELRPEKPYLQRNHDIVDESGWVIGGPGQEGEVLRSGTWATIRHARKTRVMVKIITPEGMVL